MRKSAVVLILLFAACHRSPETPATKVTEAANAAAPMTSAQAAPNPVTCGATTCSGATPICCLSKGESLCKAVADCPPDPSTIPMGCTGPQDCPGQRCCLHTSQKGPTFTTCTPNEQCPAVSEEAVALPMCKTAADCPAQAGSAHLTECGQVMYQESLYCLYK